MQDLDINFKNINMKKVILVILVSLVTLTAFSQKKSAVHKFEVNGVCEMCKERIEETCLATKGVKYATWNVETKQLKVIINEKKTSALTVKENLAKIGHDSKEVKASDEAYNNLHECCKYRSGEETH